MASVYRPVNDIINRLWAQASMEGDYLSTTPRWAIQLRARQGLQEFIEKYTSQVRSMRLTVKDNNWVELPHDFIKLLGVSEFSECGKLRPIGVNTNILSANQYLLDNENRRLLDDNGIPLLGSADGDIDRECDKYDYGNACAFNSYLYRTPYYSNYASLFRYYNINDSFVKDIEYKLDTNNDKIQFSGRNPEEVIVDYSYNPMLSDGEVKNLEIHRYFADALEKYVYYQIVATKRDNIVPQREKFRAQKAYEKSLLEARLHKNSPTFQLLKYTTNLK
jgi:hypothetical protein